MCFAGFGGMLTTVKVKRMVRLATFQDWSRQNEDQTEYTKSTQSP